VELLPIELVLTGSGTILHTDAATGSVTLTLSGRELVLYHNKSLASVAGELRLLSSPCFLDDGQWLVPIDGLPRLLGYLLAQTVEWRGAARVLLVGDVKVPRIDVSAFASGEAVRVVVASSEKVPFQVKQGEGRVFVDIERDLIDVKLDQERLTGGIVDTIAYTSGKRNTLHITLGRRFYQLKASEQESPPRLVLEFYAPPAPATAAGAAAPSTTARAPETPKPRAAEPPRATRAVVIDPGHGGAEVGAQGTAGTLEKDVTLAIARRLRAAITNSLGFQVFMTRDKDEELPLDQRTAIANNFKADVFISIHANASRAPGAKGSEVYFLAPHASDEAAQRLALLEGGVLPEEVSAAPSSDLALILWDMAQAEHLEASSALAARIHEELAFVTGSASRGVKQAPFRVLVGAGMPAVLVEVAFLSNSEEEKLLTSEAYQSRVASAIMRGMSRYFERLGQRTADAPGRKP
jgi:N-acetylmuramoyl-L-alanine amidase